MIVKLEFVGSPAEVKDVERLKAACESLEFISILRPGDAVLLDSKPGEPPRVAYFNRRIFHSTLEAVFVFEIGVGKAEVSLVEWRTRLSEFVIRKSAILHQPQVFADQLAQFVYDLNRGKR